MALKLTYWTLSFLFFLSLGLFFERPAHAYTDPGSTLLLFQSIGAVASGVLFYFRRQLRRLFNRGGSKERTGSAGMISRADS